MKIPGNPIHEERIHFYLVSIIFVPLIFIFSGILLYQIYIAPVGSRPAPSWFYFILILVFAVFEIGFSNYNLILTSEVLIAGFPLYKKRVSWERVIGAEQDRTSPWRFGGYGIRIAGKNTKRVLAFMVPGTARIKLRLKDSKWSYMVISTKNPDGVLNHIRLKIKVKK